MTPAAIAHIASVDRTMRKLVQRVGPCEIAAPKRQQPFQTLLYAIAHQQLHGNAAKAILNRALALFPGKRHPTPAEFASVTDAQLRACGFSLNKIAAIRDLCEKAQSGVVPTLAKLSKLDDDAIVERLTAVRGIGRWTVEMLLIFQLGRPDVWPVDDYGVKNGYRLTYGLEELPKPKDLREIGEAFRPYRTTAAWYLWRATDKAT